MNMKTNCWEFMKCGRQQGGSLSALLGVCPAAIDRRLDGVHGGLNAGRACWVVAGTMGECGVQGSFAKEQMNCGKCGFFLKVRLEERENYLNSVQVLNLLK